MSERPNVCPASDSWAREGAPPAPAGFRYADRYAEAFDALFGTEPREATLPALLEGYYNVEVVDAAALRAHVCRALERAHEAGAIRPWAPRDAVAAHYAAAGAEVR